MKIRNINPLGRVDVPLLRREGDVDGEGTGCLEPGEVVDVDDDVALALLEQVGNFELVDGDELSRGLAGATVKQLREVAAAGGIDLAGATTKAEIIAAIEKGADQ